MDDDFVEKIRRAAENHIASVTADPDWAKRPKRQSVNPNSATFWLPKITAELPTWIPRTETIPYDHHEAVCQMEGESPYGDWPQVLSKVADAARVVGYPVFIRTDLASAKHGGPTDYRANNESELPHVLFSTVEDNEIKFWLEGGPEVFLVREFLNLEAPFIAFHGLPIAREWRFFATHKNIICSHPYWPADALLFNDKNPEPTNWRERLAVLHKRPSDLEWEALCLTAQRAVKACGLDTAWSVDFARDVSGKWWLIDMALMDRSWHWPGCASADSSATE